MLLSVIVPTRERSDTLATTLKTILDQDSSDTEVLVSDNASQDETTEVIQRVADPRLRYVRTPQRVPMCDNFEFALNQSFGDYVLFLGDDDALLPGALSKIEHEIADTKREIYFWPTHAYRPPSPGVDAEVVSVAAPQRTRDVQIKPLALFAVKWGGWRYYALPHPYHGCVSRELLGRIRSKTGRVFHSLAPDMFTCAALPALCDTARYIGDPLSVYVFSIRSNGAQSPSLDTGRSGSALERFVAEYDGYNLHPSLPASLQLEHAIIVDSILRATELFPEFYGGVKFNYPAMWAYGWRRWGSGGNLRTILKKRKEIKRLHHFRTGEFLFYCAMHSALELRYRRSHAGITTKIGRAVPPSVEEFIKLVQNLHENGDKRPATSPGVDRGCAV